MTWRALLLVALAASASAGRATEADVAAAARAAVADVWADAEVRVVRLSGDAATARPPLRVRFREAAPRGRASAEVEAYSDGAWVPAGWAFVEVAVFDTAAVLIRDVARGEPLADAVRLDRVDVTRLRGALSPAALWKTAWTATRTLRAGAVLTDRVVAAPVASASGEPVRVRYLRGGVTVVLDCQARESGAVGEAIRVVCSDTRATYRVSLTAPGEGDWTATL